MVSVFSTYLPPAFTTVPVIGLWFCDGLVESWVAVEGDWLGGVCVVSCEGLDCVGAGELGL